MYSDNYSVWWNTVVFHDILHETSEPTVTKEHKNKINIWAKKKKNKNSAQYTVDTQDISW